MYGCIHECVVFCFIYTIEVRIFSFFSFSFFWGTDVANERISRWSQIAKWHVPFALRHQSCGGVDHFICKVCPGDAGGVHRNVGVTCLEKADKRLVY